MYELLAILLGFVGLLITQAGLHHRGMREQDAKREQMVATLAEERRVEAERLAHERREEQRELLDRMAQQSDRVVEGALQVAEVHKDDAETARLLAIESARKHAECDMKVAHLAGKVEELRARIAENERTAQDQQRIAEEDRGLKHDSLTALTVSEGTVDLVQKFVPDCTCEAFKPIEHLVMSFHPRAPALIEANSRIRHPPAAVARPTPQASTGDPA